MAATYTAISSSTLTATASSITFSSIPATYTELFISVYGKYDGFATVGIQFNSSTTSYSYLRQLGSGSSALAFYNNTAGSYSGTGVWDTGLSAMEIWIPGYKDTNKRKSFISKTYHRGNCLCVNLGSWSGTAAISSITILGNGVYQIGTVATLFGVLA